ncbi:hypothetical protein V6N11_080022 [Hibiscus sabdariffa]|uniref:Uncharacterized protein n=1 Tax=Hibiscus sabdariffa TaxID=183260 RepID=A0ABR2RXL4_9ROSI
MTHVSDIKLIRTYTTLDLSQKAEKGMLLKAEVWFLSSLHVAPSYTDLVMWDFGALTGVLYCTRETLATFRWPLQTLKQLSVTSLHVLKQ